MKELSSPYTFFYKYVFIMIWIIGFGLGTREILLAGPGEPRWIQYMATWAFFTLAIYFITGHVKQVSMDRTHLYITNYLKKEQVPLKEIEDIDGATFISPRLVWIILKSPSGFGKRIVFIPAMRKGPGIGKHPLVRELREELKMDRAV